MLAIPAQLPIPRLPPRTRTLADTAISSRLPQRNFEHLMAFDHADDLPIKAKDKKKKSRCIELGMATHFNYRNLRKIQGLPPMIWWDSN
jgi:hypothetical protein